VAIAPRPVDDNGFIPASTGAVSLNIDWHADITNPTPGAALHDRSVAFTADMPDSLALLGLTSNGVTITYALSEKGQRDTYDTSMSDVDLLPNAETAKDIHAAEQKYGIHYQVTDIAWQEGANNDGNAAQQQIEKILQEGRRR